MSVCQGKLPAPRPSQHSAKQLFDMERLEWELQQQNKRFVMEYEQRAVEEEMREAAEAERGTRGPRGARLFFSHSRGGRGRGGSRPKAQKPNFEGELLRQMGYAKDRPKDYGGGDAVFKLGE